MNGMNYFFRFRRSQEDNISDSESLKKKVEDSKATLALIQAQKENELSFLKERVTVLETWLAEDNSVAQARIIDLEAKLAATNVRSEKAIQDHSNI